MDKEVTIMLVIRSEQKESINVWKGERVWFSPNLLVQRLSIEDGDLIVQVDSAFKVEHNEEEGKIAVIAYGEDLSQVQEPPFLVKLSSRIISRLKK